MCAQSGDDIARRELEYDDAIERWTKCRKEYGRRVAQVAGGAGSEWGDEEYEQVWNRQ